MTSLAHILRRRIETEGPITVAEYMSAALVHPEFGYYTRQDPFGTAGDFITAPEISQMFGELIGLWLAATWQQLGSPPNAHIIELGPGRGTLMADALRALQMVPELHAGADIHLVEASPALRAVQSETLADYNVYWHDGMESLPDGPCLLIANEFLDALPIRQIVRQDGSWHERLIGWEDNQFTFLLDRAPTPLSALLPDNLIDTAPPQSLIEISPAVLGIARAIAQRIDRDGGAALMVDYGYAETAPGETFQAIRGHQTVDVLEEPGMADLTAHVDFGAFARAASCVDVHGPVEQGEFLFRLGIETRRDTLSKAADVKTKKALETAVRRLTDRAEMGQLFKVVSLAQKGSPVPAGFEGNSSG